MICALLWPTIFSHFANSTVDRVAAIGYTAYVLNWYDQPVNMQKYVILFIARSYERINFSGLNLIPCSMEAFGKVCLSSE